MAQIRPFKGIRPVNEKCEDIVSLPYDVLDYDEVKNEISKNPLSFFNIIRSEALFPKDSDHYSRDVYEKARENLLKFIDEGKLKQDSTLSYYVYRLKKGNISQTGFIGTVSIDEYNRGTIKRHEKTRIEKENDRINHIETLGAHTGFVFLTYKAVNNLQLILNEIEKTPHEISFTSPDNVTHTFWVINDSDIINNITQSFDKIPYLYIADGHHRAAASAAVGNKLKKNNSDDNSNYFLSIIFPHNHLKILPYNRGVHDLNGLEKTNFLNKIEKNFSVEEVKQNAEETGYRPLSAKEIGMYLDDKWYNLKARQNLRTIDDPVESLDVALLQNYILSPILNINDPRTDKRIEFIGGVRGTAYLKNTVDSNKFKVTFSMYPTSIEQLMSVADANKLMPPKSTWFEPKPRSGFAVYKIK